LITIKELNLSTPVLEAISKMGFVQLTPIQAKTIPLSLAGKDVIGQAQTGTGKTAAYGIPLVERLDPRQKHIQALVITPTRELAVQVAEALNQIGQLKHIRTLPIYGGQDIKRQIRDLAKGPHIIVGTPGRLLDHLRRKTMRLNQLQTVVLDEADEMLDMGFMNDIESILKNVPAKHQTLLFSATMPQKIKNLAQQFMSHPETVATGTQELTMPNIDQYYLRVQERQKFDTLCRLLDIQALDLAIIFGRTKRRVRELAEALGKRGYSVDGMHGDLNQSKRDRVMRAFRNGSIEILVATDVAARGLDVSGVTHVFNFDIPQDSDSYVHRIGRTGRAGKSGEAITFVTPREMNQLRRIEQSTKGKIVRQSVPALSAAI
jgi:ATP-dependent RNA helicase DeaD